MNQINFKSPGLDLNQLRTFFTFGQVKSHKETARLLHVTQPAVSHALKKLTDSVGSALVARQGQRYVLTDAGERLHRSCAAIFYEIERAEEDLRQTLHQQPSQVVLGATVEFGTTLLIKQMAMFQATHSVIHVDYLFSHSLLDRLLRDEVDLIIDCWTHQHPALIVIPLLTERYIVVAAPMFIDRHRVETPQDLSAVPVLSLDSAGAWWNNFLTMLSAAERPVFQHLIQINHIRGLINGAVAGMGVALVPRYTVAQELASNTLVELLPGWPLKDDEFCIYVKSARRDLVKLATVISYLNAAFAGLGGTI